MSCSIRPPHSNLSICTFRIGVWCVQWFVWATATTTLCSSTWVTNLEVQSLQNTVCLLTLTLQYYTHTTGATHQQHRRHVGVYDVCVYRYGHRVDRVAYHPSYHVLMDTGLRNGTAAFAWNRPNNPSAHIIRAAMMYMQNAVDPGTCCPQVMTFAGRTRRLTDDSSLKVRLQRSQRFSGRNPNA
jgi:hypothetical protein